MLVDLKWEHRIYEQDFDSKQEFKKGIKILIEELKERKDELKKIKNKDYDEWENNKAFEEYEKIIEKSIDIVEKYIDRLEDKKGEIR